MQDAARVIVDICLLTIVPFSTLLAMSPSPRFKHDELRFAETDSKLGLLTEACHSMYLPLKHGEQHTTELA